MGSWGTAISSNDTYADVYGSFFASYNNGLEVSEISAKLISTNQEIINDTLDSNNFWFALAKAQWECKQLDNIILARVKNIVETGIDIEAWRKLGADVKQLKAREKALIKFLSDLQKERAKAKARKKKIIRQPVFEKGDCLTFKLTNANYGGAVVLEAIKDGEHGLNLIAVTRINQQEKPIRSDFENAEVLILNFASWNDKPNVFWYFPVRHKLIANLFEVVDSIKVGLNYDANKSMLRFVGDLDITIIQCTNLQFESENIKLRPGLRQTISEYAK